MRARPTTYKGVRMRSRTEALFAASLEGLCSWEYEPEAYADEHGQYLPDFRCRWSHADTSYVEIKPTWGQVNAAASQMERILRSEPEAHLTVYIPTGDWPNVTFHMAATRSGVNGTWRFIPPPTP